MNIRTFFLLTRLCTHATKNVRGRKAEKKNRLRERKRQRDRETERQRDREKERKRERRGHG